MKFFFTVFLLVCLVVFVPTSVTAHNLGFSIEVVEGPYLVDIGYSPEDITDQTQTRFDFDVFNNETNESIRFDNIWFRIEKDKKVYFAGGLSRQKFGATGMSYRFAEAGTYDLYVRFSSSSEAITETTVPFEVTKAPDERSFFEKNVDALPPFIVGIILAVLGSRFLPVKRKVS